MNSPAANTTTAPPHCCTCCTCTIRRWVLAPELRVVDFDEAIELGLIQPDALAIPLRAVSP